MPPGVLWSAGGCHAALLVQRHDHEERGQGSAGHGGGGEGPWLWEEGLGLSMLVGNGWQGGDTSSTCCCCTSIVLTQTSSFMQTRSPPASSVPTPSASPPPPQVRRQFNVITGLMEGTARPDYSRCVEISTSSSLHEMIAPGGLGLGWGGGGAYSACVNQAPEGVGVNVHMALSHGRLHIRQTGCWSHHTQGCQEDPSP